MKIEKAYILFFIILICNFMVGCKTIDNRLSGKWRSNLELTQSYNDKNAKLTDRQQKFFAQLFGKMEIDYFTPGRYRVYFPEIAIHTVKRDIETPASEEVLEYEIIYRDERVVVTVTNDPVLGKTVRILNFISCDTYWIYLGSGSIVALNMREYFSKVK